LIKRKPAVFLDRDGTIIQDVGYLKNIEDIEIFPDTITSLLSLQKHFELFIITNQIGVSRKSITMEEVQGIHRELDDVFSSSGINIREWYVCPHEKGDNCGNRKPEPGFLVQAAEKFNLDLSRSFIIGDHPHDVITGKNLGVFGIYVLSGHGRKHLGDLDASSLIFHSLGDAAAWILNHSRGTSDLRSMISAGARQLKNGGLVAFPTETVYGLGADAFNPEAVERIFRVKQRPLYNPLIVHVAEQKQIEGLCPGVPETAYKLMKDFWPGPLTLVLPKTSSVPDIVTAGNPTVAIRMPSHPIALELINEAGTPVAAPSANSFGRTSPTTAAHVHSQLGGKIDFIIDGGACRVGVESTVLSLIGPRPILLRPGGITKEMIESVIGPIEMKGTFQNEHLPSPGLLSSHYAPDTPLYLLDTIPLDLYSDPSVGFLLFTPPDQQPAGPLEILSSTGNLEEAATNLYAAMQRLDVKNLRMIVAHRLPDTMIGAAINDRLFKASTKNEDT